MRGRAQHPRKHLAGTLTYQAVIWCAVMNRRLRTLVLVATELDAHLLRTVNPNMTTGPLAGGGDPAVAGGGDAGDAMKEEPVDMTTSDPVDLSVGQLMTAATAATTATTLLGTVTQQTTLLRQPTVVLGVATTAAATDPMSLLQTDRVILSRVNIKLEPMDVSDAEHISE